MRKFCEKCKFATVFRDNLCKECYNYAIWKGDIGPGELLKKTIKEENNKRRQNEI